MTFHRRALYGEAPIIVPRNMKGSIVWDEIELAYHAQNLQRLLWIACGDIVNGNN